ncbi:MAG: hypothetical protein U5K00_00610 [Melioribacteraceae bacterium]|nr:hypothetical protein [Melioribacteraceae bacterium]
MVSYSPVYHFETKGGVVTAYPSWPVGGATIYYLDPTFYWYTMENASNTDFTVIYSADGSTDGSGVLDTDTTRIPAGNTTFVPIDADLDPSTDYYWQVESNFGTEYEYSTVAEFTTYDAPGFTATKPTPSYPTGGLTIYTTSPTLHWYIGATKYRQLLF